MAYCTPQIICGCGLIHSLHDFMKEKISSIKIDCSCGTSILIQIFVPKKLLTFDIIQKIDFEKIHGKTE